MDKEKVSKYKDIIDDARSIDLRTLKTFNSLFNLKENPFSNFPKGNVEEYFVNREETIESLVYELGIASRGVNRDILIISPFGFGKSTLIKYISFIIIGLMKQKNEKYHFSGLLKSAKELFLKDDDSEDSLQLWVRKSKEKMDYIMVDDVTKNQAKTILREFTRTKLRLLVISPIDFLEIYNNMSQSPKTYFLKAFGYSTILEMLDKYIGNVRIDQEEEKSIYDLFDSKALDLIYKFTKGIPYLVIECIRASLELLQSNLNNRKRKNVNREYIIESNIALQACKQTGCYQAFTEINSLNKAKKRILNEILRVEKTPSEISEKLNKNRTTISRHLSDLKELGLIDSYNRGREILYQATIPSKIVMEIETIPDGESKFGTD